MMSAVHVCHCAAATEKILNLDTVAIIHLRYKVFHDKSPARATAVVERFGSGSASGFGRMVYGNGGWACSKQAVEMDGGKQAQTVPGV